MAYQYIWYFFFEGIAPDSTYNIKPTNVMLVDGWIVEANYVVVCEASPTANTQSFLQLSTTTEEISETTIDARATRAIPQLVAVNQTSAYGYSMDHSGITNFLLVPEDMILADAVSITEYSKVPVHAGQQLMFYSTQNSIVGTDTTGSYSIFGAIKVRVAKEAWK